MVLIVAQHMPADGGVWITNTVKYHNAFNMERKTEFICSLCIRL